MEAVRIDTKVQQNGRIILNDLPFEEGKEVEVIILEAETQQVTVKNNPLKGSILRYDDPFGPACPIEDWEALR